MSTAELDYWDECITSAAEEIGLTLTREQATYLADAVYGANQCYSMAFYSPPASERVSDIEREWKAKLAALKAEHDRYVENAETAVKRALGIHHGDRVAIEAFGDVLRVGGRTERVL